MFLHVNVLLAFGLLVWHPRHSVTLLSMIIINLLYDCVTTCLSRSEARQQFADLTLLICWRLTRPLPTPDYGGLPALSSFADVEPFGGTVEL